MLREKEGMWIQWKGCPQKERLERLLARNKDGCGEANWGMNYAIGNYSCPQKYTRESHVLRKDEFKTSNLLQTDEKPSRLYCLPSQISVKLTRA